MSNTHQVDNRRRAITRFVLSAAFTCLLHHESISSFVRSANASEDVETSFNSQKFDYLSEEYELLAHKQNITEIPNTEPFRLLNEESASGAENGATDCDENCEEFVKKEEGEADVDAGIVDDSGEGEPAEEEDEAPAVKSAMELADQDAIYPKDVPFSRE